VAVQAGMTTDLHTLTGAYVLHATSDTERVAFERHLTDCQPCAQEVRELRETATRLGLAATTTPPPHLRPAVLARIHTESQLRAGRSGPALTTWLTTAAAVVLLTVTLSLTAILATRHDDLAQARHRTDVLATVLHAEDARSTHDDGITLVSSRTQNRAVLLTNLPPAPDGHDYRTWLVDTRYHSAGTLADNGLTELTGVATMDRIAITIEPDGGSPQPTTTPIADTEIP
jgi:anti-sigma-K factor RskA